MNCMMMILYLPDNKEVSGNRKDLIDLKKWFIMGNGRVCGDKYRKPTRHSLTHLKNNCIVSTSTDSENQLK